MRCRSPNPALAATCFFGTPSFNSARAYSSRVISTNCTGETPRDAENLRLRVRWLMLASVARSSSFHSRPGSAETVSASLANLGSRLNCACNRLEYWLCPPPRRNDSSGFQLLARRRRLWFKYHLPGWRRLSDVTKALGDVGFEEKEIAGIMGSNFRRVAEQVWK